MRILFLSKWKSKSSAVLSHLHSSSCKTFRSIQENCATINSQRTDIKSVKNGWWKTSLKTFPPETWSCHQGNSELIDVYVPPPYPHRPSYHRLQRRQGRPIPNTIRIHQQTRNCQLGISALTHIFFLSWGSKAIDKKVYNFTVNLMLK